MSLVAAILLFVFGFVCAGYSDQSPWLGTLALVFFAASALVWLVAAYCAVASLLKWPN